MGIAVLALGLGGRPPTAQEVPSIDPEVRAGLSSGRVRVLVELRLPEGPPSAGDPAAARARAIAATQQAVLARLAGTTALVTRQYASVPLLALEIGPDALLALERMGDLVARVHGDRLRRPSPGP